MAWRQVFCFLVAPEKGNRACRCRFGGDIDVWNQGHSRLQRGGKSLTEAELKGGMPAGWLVQVCRCRRYASMLSVVCLAGRPILPSQNSLHVHAWFHDGCPNHYFSHSFPVFCYLLASSFGHRAEVLHWGGQRPTSTRPATVAGRQC